MDVIPIQHEMAFHQFSSSSSFDQVYFGSYDDRFRKSPFPLDYRQSFCTYPPDLISASSQNVVANYYHTSSRNVPYSSFFSGPCYQLPYSNPTLVTNRFQSDPWASASGHETYGMTPPYSPNQVINNSLSGRYSMQRNLPMPDPTYRGYSRHVDCGFLATCSSSPDLQSSDFHTFDSNSMMAQVPQIQHYRHPECVFQGIGDRGISHHSAVPHDYSRDEITQSTVTSSEDRNMFHIQSSSWDVDSTRQTTFENYLPPNQLHTLGHNFEVDDRINTFSKSSAVSYNANDASANKSMDISHQSPDDISIVLGTERGFTDCALDDCGHSTHADCMVSSSRLMPRVSEARISAQTDMMSTTAGDFLCQSMPEMPQRREEPAAFLPSLHASNMYSIGPESSCRDITSVSPVQTTLGMSDVSAGTSEFKAKEDEQIGVSDVETDTSCVALSDAFTASAPAAAFSTTMQFLAENSENSHAISPVKAATPPEVSVSATEARSIQEVMPEAAVITEPDTVNCQSVDMYSISTDDDDDDVIVLSPMPVTSEPTSVVSTDPGTSAAKSCSQMQPTCIRGQPNASHCLFSAVHPTVPKSVSAKQPYISSRAVGVDHCYSSPSVLLTSHDFTKSRSHYVLRSHAKQTSHNCSIQTTSLQQHVPNSVISGIPTASHMSNRLANATTCSFVKQSGFRHPQNAVTHDSVQKGRERFVRMQRERLPHWTPSAVRDTLSNCRTCKLTVGSCGHCNAFRKPYHSGIKKPMPVTSQAFPLHAVTHCRVPQNVRPIFSSRISHNSAAVRANLLQNLPTRYKPQFLVCTQGSSVLLLQSASLRKHGTYCVHAASVMLQRLSQRRLSDCVSSRAARQQRLQNRRHSLLSQTGVSDLPDVIDLTDCTEQNAVETCEDIFSRTRRRMMRNRHLHQPRQNFIRRSSVACGSCSDLVRQPRDKAYAVDRSLPFYRCFVQNLLRHFKFSSKGVPVQIWPPFPDVMLSALTSTAAAARRASITDHSSIDKELVKKRQPVVVLKKLDQSILNEYGSVKIGTLKSGVCALTASPRIELEDCLAHELSASGNSSQKLQSYESRNKVCVHTSRNAVDAKYDQTKEETDQKGAVITKVAAVGLELEHKNNVHDSRDEVDTYRGQKIADCDYMKKDTNQTLQSGVYALAASPRVELEDCITHASRVSCDAPQEVQSYESHDNASTHTCWNAVNTKFDQTEEETDLKETTSTKMAAVGWELEHKNNKHDSQDVADTYHGQKIADLNWIEKENNHKILKENVEVKLSANGQQEFHELLSLCRPVSVVLERLDNTEIYNSCRDSCKTEMCHQDNKHAAQLKTELSASSHNWTAIQIPRANKVPVIIIRALPSSAVNTSQNKLTEQTPECQARCLRKYASKYSTNRHGTTHIQRFRDVALRCSELDVSQARVSKKMPQSRKLHLADSLSMSLRSSRFLRSCHVLMPLTRPAYRIISKCHKKQTKAPSKLSVKRDRRGRFVCSELTNRLHKRESSATSIDEDVISVVSDSTCKNVVPTRLLSCDSGSNTVELARSTLNVIPITPVEHGTCFTPSALSQDNALSGDLLIRDSVLHEHLSDDYELSDATVLSSADVINSVHPSTSFSLTSKNALTSDLLTYHSVSEDLQEDCVSSDCDTIILSRQSSVDDLTVAYRSPLCDLSDFDEPPLYQQEWLDGSLDADVNIQKFNLETVASDRELRPPSASDHVASTYNTVFSEPYIAGSVHFSSNPVESCMFSESRDCSLITSNAADSKQLQPVPVHLFGPRNVGAETQHSVNNSLSVLVDGDEKKHGAAAASVSVAVVL